MSCRNSILIAREKGRQKNGDKIGNKGKRGSERYVEGLLLTCCSKLVISVWYERIFGMSS